MSAPSTHMDHSLDDKGKHEKAQVDNESVSEQSLSDDDRILQEIGYVPSFKREFSNLATVRTVHDREVILAAAAFLRSE